MNRPALIISLLLTALVLTIAGGVIYSTRALQNAQAAQPAVEAVQPADPSAAQPAVDNSQASLDPQSQQALIDREAEYQKIIAEANARLAQDEKTQQALQAQIAAMQSSAAPAPVAAPAASEPVTPTGISPQQAAEIASQYIGKTQVYSVETDDYKDATVYKVTFSTGQTVIVSLNGDVLAVIKGSHSGSQGQMGFESSSGEHESEHEGEHEFGDD